MPKFCRYCGAPLMEGAKFCTGCGQPVTQATSNQQTPDQQRRGENLSSSKSKPNQQTTSPTPKKKKKRTGRKVFLMLLLIVAVGYGIKGYLQHKKGGSGDLPTVVLEGNGFKLEVAESDKDLEFTPVGNERLAELKRMGYNPIVTPIRVSRNGNNHVELKRWATLSFDIPADFPKDQYDELVGVIITDEGPEYKIPDYQALKQGVVKFGTYHFSDATVEKKKEELRKQFIENVAVNGWTNHINDDALKPKLKEKLNEYAKSLGFGEDDPMGVIVREMYADDDNTLVAIGSDLINAYDMEGDDIEKRIEVATQTMVKEAESKVLSYLFDKLKEEDTKKKKVIDELNSTGNETKYKTEIEEIDSKRNKIIDVLKDRFTISNAEEVSKDLGEMTTFGEFYAYAKKQLKEQGEEKLKEISINLCPYIKTVQMTAGVVELGKKFWATVQINDYYKEYEKEAKANNGRVENDWWDLVTLRSSAPKFLHGMTNEEIKQMFAERYQKKVEIEKRKEEATKTVELIESHVDLKADCFETKKLDYSQRLTVVNNLLNRFYAELVDKRGNLTFIDASTKTWQNYSAEKNIKEQLCEVVNEYLKCYPDQQKFYTWLAKNGYNQNKLKRDFAKLDALLDKPKNDPMVSIVIQETLGAESGSAKYAGRTICLGTNGKSCPGWYRNIPDDDETRDYGWSREFPKEDSSMPLSQYKKAFGRPNQVLIYKDVNAYERDEAPLEAIDFVLDTTGKTTVVELNDEVTGEYYSNHVELEMASIFDFDDDYIVGDIVDVETIPYSRDKAQNCLEAVIKFMKSGNFGITVSGEYKENGSMLETTIVTINGHVDKDTGRGTFTMKGTVRRFYNDKERIITFEASGDVLHPDEYKKANVSDGKGRLCFDETKGFSLIAGKAYYYDSFRRKEWGMNLYDVIDLYVKLAMPVSK